MFLRQPLPTILHCLLGNWRRDYFGKLYGACVQSGPQKGEEHLVPYHNVAKSRDIWHMNLWSRGNQEKSVMSSKVFRVCFCRRSIALPLTSANTPGTNHPEGPRMRKVAKPACSPGAVTGLDAGHLPYGSCAISLVNAGKSYHVGMADMVLQWLSDSKLSAGKESPARALYMSTRS